MPQKRAAYKELRKSVKRRLRNTKIISETRTFVKKFNFLLSQKKFDEAKEFLKEVSSKFHKAARKGVIPKGTASRKISRLSRKLYKNLSSAKK